MSVNPAAGSSTDIPTQSRTTTNARAAGSAFPDEADTREAKRLRIERQEEQDDDMGGLVQYGSDDEKTTATVRLHVLRHDDDNDAREAEARIDQDCEERDDRGRYFVKVTVNRRGSQDRSRQPSAEQIGANAEGGPRGRVIQRDWKEIRMNSEDHGVNVLTNAPEIAHEVSKMTTKDTLQEAVERGAREQWRRDASWTIDTITTTEQTTRMYWDDLTGEQLDSTAVEAARKLEIEYFHKMTVYEKVPISQAKEVGKQILGVRWVDVRKADGTHRSRLVAKEIKTYNAPELFAATPPIETLKYLMRRAAQDRSLEIMHIDVTRAYFYADVSRDVYVRLPAEDQAPGEEHLCGKLVKAMYGTRDAAQNWQKKCSEVVQELGFRVGRVSPCHFYHAESGTCGMVHGDDFVFVGRRNFLKGVSKHMGEVQHKDSCSRRRTSRGAQGAQQEDQVDLHRHRVRERPQARRQAH